MLIWHRKSKLTCAGAPIKPVETPATILPANIEKCDDAVAKIDHPIKSGNIAIIIAGRLP